MPPMRPQVVAFDQLAPRANEFLRRAFGRYKLAAMLPTEDVHAAALLGIWRAVRTHNPARGHIDTWACYCVRLAVYDMHRERHMLHNQRRARGQEMRRLDDIPPRTAEDPALTHAEHRHDMEVYLQLATPRQHSIAVLLLRGMSQCEAARELGMAESSVSQALGRWYQRVREHCNGTR